ncbi:MAG: uracil-DNA glycosylase [Candidatus Gracilibacteria bacterium]|nr:uracil-DNA glycosylase [Candidatus Gracilibacteria bacterium]
MPVRIHPSWQAVLAAEFEKPYWESLTSFVKEEYSTTRCFPEGKNIFRAFDLTPFDDVKVVILGQDPYHTAGAAMGLSFSVPSGSKPQPSLRNIFKELQDDLGKNRTNTDLTDWAEQGVLLLNAVLTVREASPASHGGKGWEQFTDSVIRLLSEKREGLVFILWGNFAISKKSLVDAKKHHIITSPHPSPFSAHNGFFGSKPFSKTNAFLKDTGKKEIDW